jgi:hypothetical protein
MNKYAVFFVILLMNIISIRAQSSIVKDTIPDYGIYNSLQDFFSHKLIYSFSKKEKGCKLKQPKLYIAKIITPNFSKIVDLRDVWGFRASGSDWRYKQGDLFEVVNHEGIWIYQKTIIDDGGSNILYYFSKSPDSEIIWLSRKKLKEAYTDDQEFLRVLGLLKWNQSIEKTIPPNGNLRIVELYKVAHKMF